MYVPNVLFACCFRIIICVNIPMLEVPDSNYKQLSYIALELAIEQITFLCFSSS
jgi:hypothetical protein